MPLSTQTTPSNEIKNTSLSSEVAVKTKEKSKASRQEIYAGKKKKFFLYV